ncbi:hypothetical protein GOAMI_31_00660 [Gordonia amicalis NBRC 100051 = JCM 11271]|nr:hypothetical protein GOAMI_31_00660 [Gordonia amicalis NBRC 100051 = JCM 11271]
MVILWRSVVAEWRWPREADARFANRIWVTVTRCPAAPTGPAPILDVRGDPVVCAGSKPRNVPAPLPLLGDDASWLSGRSGAELSDRAEEYGRSGSDLAAIAAM